MYGGVGEGGGGSSLESASAILPAQVLHVRIAQHANHAGGSCVAVIAHLSNLMHVCVSAFSGAANNKSLASLVAC